MSRTHRTHLTWRVLAYGRYWTWEEESEHWKSLGGWHGGLGWSGRLLVDRRCRDKKPVDKPGREFKAMKRRKERAQVRHAMNAEREIPRFRKSDQWDWT